MPRNMPALIIGLVGLQGCGKGTVAKHLEERFGAKTFRYSAILKEMLERLALENRRDSLTTLSTALREAFGEDALSYAIARDAIRSDAPIAVVDGIRRIEDISGLEALPQFHLVEIVSDAKTRFERLRGRTEKIDEVGMTWEGFLAGEDNPTEQTIPQVASRAEVRIANDGSLEDLQARIDDVVHRLKVAS